MTAITQIVILFLRQIAHPKQKASHSLEEKLHMRTDTADAAVKAISSSHRGQQGYSTWLRCQTYWLLEKHTTMKMKNISGQSCKNSTQSYGWTHKHLPARACTHTLVLQC